MNVRRRIEVRRATDSRSAKEPAAPADIPAIESRLASALARSNHRIAATHRRALAAYVALLAQWNRAYNLTAVRDPFAMIDRHVLDSLTVLDFLVGARLLDAGTGAGLPGLVLAVVRPDVRCTLLDPVRKKTRFCAHAAMTLGLDNVEVASERLAAHRPPHRYSTVISRATFTVAELVAGARPLLDATGRIIAMKGPRPETELDELDASGGEGLEVRVEPIGTGAGAPHATLVIVDRAGRPVGVPMREDVTIRQPSMRTGRRLASAPGPAGIAGGRKAGGKPDTGDIAGEPTPARNEPWPRSSR